MRGGRGRGRGAYYKEKYGGGRGRRQEQETSEVYDSGGSDGDHDQYSAQAGSFQDLTNTLKRINGKQYGAYKDTKGLWTDGNFTLGIDHVQSDAYAAPSRCHVEVPSHIARFDPSLRQSKIRRIALCDFLTRSFAAVIKQAGGDVRMQGGWSSAKGGEMTIDTGGQHVLERTSVLIDAQGNLEARFTVGLPAQGRTILGDLASQILIRNLPRYVREGLLSFSLDMNAIRAHIECVEDTQALRDSLPKHGLVAFVGNGAILPRASGASDAPLAKAAAVPFKSPSSMEVQIQLPNGKQVAGMGVRPGVTLIVGGGFHGKSTLLKALESGYTNKVPGDGREMVVTIPSAFKIRAEDGRRVQGVNISPFISNLPMNMDTTAFCSEDASGSTSQAANIMEALELGARLLLIDEDTTATNFMIRDTRMQALVAPNKEPITPLVSRISSLAHSGTSCILVIGGSGAYFDVADTVVAMDCFAAKDVTGQAHAIAGQSQRERTSPADGEAFPAPTPRSPTHIHTDGGGRMRIKIHDMHTIFFGNEQIDLGCVEQLLDKSQTRAIGQALLLLMRVIREPEGRGRCLADILAALDARIDGKGLDVLSQQGRATDLARPRMLEVAAAINRLRSVRVEQKRH